MNTKYQYSGSPRRNGQILIKVHFPKSKPGRKGEYEQMKYW